MKYIALTSGRIINLDLVAFITTPGIAKNETPEQAKLEVSFAAIYSVPGGGGTMTLQLDASEAKEFLAELAILGVLTGHTTAALTHPQD